VTLITIIVLGISYNITREVIRMLANIGIPGLILIIVLALIIFGPKRLPEMGRAIGQTLTEFKKSTKNLVGNDTDDTQETTKATATTQAKAEVVEEKASTPKN